MQIPVEKKYQQKDFFRSLFRPRGTHFEPFAWARRSVRNQKTNASASAEAFVLNCYSTGLLNRTGRFLDHCTRRNSRNRNRLALRLADVDAALEERAILNADARCGHVAAQ